MTATPTPSANDNAAPTKGRNMSASLYRKLPVTISAIKCEDAMTTAQNDWSQLPKWLIARYEKGGVVFTSEGIHLPTLEGSMLAHPDDMIICGVQGEVYPCKPDIFAATYEALP